MQWLLRGAVFAVFSWRNFRWPVRQSWGLLLLPCLFPAMSLDEVAQIHEWLGHCSDVLLEGGTREASVFRVTGIWMFIIGGPFVVLFTALIISVRPYFAGARGALDKTCLGMMVTLSGAIGVQTLSNFLIPGSALAMAEVAVEEFLEMAGSTLVLWGGLDLLAIHGFAVQLNPVPMSRDKSAVPTAKKTA